MIYDVFQRSIFNDKYMFPDFAYGPLTEYRKRASFDWKKVKVTILDIEALKFRVCFFKINIQKVILSVFYNNIIKYVALYYIVLSFFRSSFTCNILIFNILKSLLKYFLNLLI